MTTQGHDDFDDSNNDMMTVCDDLPWWHVNDVTATLTRQPQ